jgi:hypothetical protein
MLAPRILVLVFLAVACSASEEQRAAARCRTDIPTWLPRPETVEFLAFEPISRQEYISQFAQIMTTPGASSSFQGAVEDLSREHAERMTARGASFYRYRIRSQDASGNPVASDAVCAANAMACTCSNRQRFDDYSASRRRP